MSRPRSKVIKVNQGWFSAAWPRNESKWLAQRTPEQTDSIGPCMLQWSLVCSSYQRYWRRPFHQVFHQVQSSCSSIKAWLSRSIQVYQLSSIIKCLDLPCELHLWPQAWIPGRRNRLKPRTFNHPLGFHRFFHRFFNDPPHPTRAFARTLRTAPASSKIFRLHMSWAWRAPGAQLHSMATVLGDCHPIFETIILSIIALSFKALSPPFAPPRYIQYLFFLSPLPYQTDSNSLKQLSTAEVGVVLKSCSETVEEGARTVDLGIDTSCFVAVCSGIARIEFLKWWCQEQI